MDSSDEELMQMAPPPKPHAHPQQLIDISKSLPSLKSHSSLSNDNMDLEENVETEMLKAPPRPHAHPLQYHKSRQSTIQQSTQLHKRNTIHGERLHPYFLNPMRITKLLELENKDLYTNNEMLINETLNDGPSAIIEKKLKQVREEKIRGVKFSPPETILDANDRMIAATKAVNIKETEEEMKLTPFTHDGNSSLLQRASERKIGKQINSKWLQSRQEDAKYCPKLPLENPDEAHLYESIFHPEDEIGKFISNKDAIYERRYNKLIAFTPKYDPWDNYLTTKGTVGIPGSSYDTFLYP